MLPITGQFFKTWETKEGATVRTKSEQWWFRQKKPYNLPLDYHVQRNTANVRRISDGFLAYGVGNNFNALWRPYVRTDASSGDPYLPEFQALRDSSLAKALTRFNERRGETASLGVMLAESRQAAQMIERRARQTLNVVLALRKLRFGDAARHLGLPSKTIRDRSREASGLQLEIAFGWKPFIGDMYKTLEVLNGPVPYGVTKGSASSNATIVAEQPGFGRATHKVKCHAFVAAVLEVERPDLDLASRLGLTNPAAVAFELIPWSFVANWVINFEEYLAQFTDYPGVKVVNPYFGFKMIDEFSTVIKEFTPDVIYAGDGLGVTFQRATGSLPSQKLGFRPSLGLPFSRALNAISLLVQKGIKGSRR